MHSKSVYFLLPLNIVINRVLHCNKQELQTLSLSMDLVP